MKGPRMQQLWLIQNDVQVSEPGHRAPAYDLQTQRRRCPVGRIRQSHFIVMTLPASVSASIVCRNSGFPRVEPRRAAPHFFFYGDG